MIKITYPPYQPKIKKDKDVEHIFDEFRKRWFVLTPEEWVRQNFLHYLTQTLHYPASLIAIEKEILLGEMKKRFDIVIYGNDSKPLLVVECKEMNVPLGKSVLEQVLRYNIKLQVQFIVITNGSHCLGFENIMGKLKELSAIPSFGKS